MPTFIGSGGGGESKIADALKNVMQQTSPLSLAHAGLYGASTRKTQAEAESAQSEADALKLLSGNGIYDPNDPRMAGALVVAKRAADALRLNAARQAALHGAASPEAAAGSVGAGDPFTTTGMGQGREIAGQNFRQGTINETSRLNNQDTNVTSRLNNQDTVAGNDVNNRRNNDTTRDVERYKVENSPTNVMVPDGKGGMIPAVRNKSDAVNPATGAQPVLDLDHVLGGASQTDPNYQPPAPSGVLQGGAVPGAIPPPPDFITGYQPPEQPAPTQTIPVPLAHDLTHTVEVPTQAPQPTPGVVNPSIVPPVTMGGPAPGQSRVSQVLDGLDPRVANAKGYRYPPQLTFINPVTNETGVSDDGGRTVIVNGQRMPNNGSFKQAGPETGVSEARTAADKASIVPFEEKNPRAGVIFQSVKKTGVGGAAGYLQKDIDTLLGSTGLAALLPYGQFGGDQNVARQRAEMFNNQMTTALLGARSGDAGIKERNRISTLLPSTGFFTNPAAEAGKIPELYGVLVEQNRDLVSRLKRPGLVGADYNKTRSMLDENVRALNMITDPSWGAKYAGSGTPDAPAGDAVSFNQRPGGPAPAGPDTGGFKILNVRDK